MSALAEQPNPGCLLCGSLTRALTGTMNNRRCFNQAACRKEIYDKSHPPAPSRDLSDRLLQGLPNTGCDLGSARVTTPAQAMIALLRQKAHVDELDGPLHYGDALRLPLAAAQGRFVCFGKSGSGKSNSSAVVIENCLDNNVPVCAIDTLGNLWGLRCDGERPGMKIPIIGGAHRDIPLRLEHAIPLAHIFSHGHSFLLDLSEFTRDDQQAFCAEYFRELMRVLRIPAHVVVEEADAICPAFTRSKTQFASQGAASLFARQIRNFGVGWTFSTQRLPLLHPEVIEASNAFVAMLTTGDIAQRGIFKETRSRVGAAVASAVLSELGQLPVGYAWLIPDPSLLETEVGPPIRFQFRKRWTYDSTAVPRIGVAVAVPSDPVRVDLKPFREIRSA
jgi:hypothetical protein